MSGPRSSIGDTPNSYCRDMTEALEADPPVITWEKRNGVMVAVEVHDPHAEPKPTARRRAPAPNADRELAAARRRLQQFRDEADEVAERFRKHRAENTPLLNAARTAI